MAEQDKGQENLRANVRRLLDNDPDYTPTSFSLKILGRGKDYLNDFLTLKKDGTYKKETLGSTEYLKFINHYGLSLGQIQSDLFNDEQAKIIVEYSKRFRSEFAPMFADPDFPEAFSVYQHEAKKATRAALVTSFDPDEPDVHESPEDFAYEGRIRIVAETEESPDFRPDDAINELLSLGGLGRGEEVELTWVREGDGHKQVDAIRDDYWRFPTSFLQKDLRKAPNQLIIIECEGDSMEPTITSGARVMVDVQHLSPSPDGIYAIRDRFGAIRIKRLQVTLSGEPMVRVICDNPSHPQEVMPLADLVVIGRVVGAIRTF